MTTIILATKLMNVNLDIAEFEKMKYQKIENFQEKHKNTNDLKKVLENQSLQKNCRLCLKPGIKKIFADKDKFHNVDAIRDILGIEILENDGKPQLICESCQSTIEMAARLKQTAKTTQWRLQQESEILLDTTTEYDIDVWRQAHGGHFNVQGATITRKWICGKCRRVFLIKDEFKEHEQLPNCRTNVRGYICETCGSEFKIMSQLKRHSAIHSAEPRHACALCPYRGRDKYALAAHLRLHSGRRPARCAQCPAAFPSASGLAAHRRSHLPPAHHCQLCRRAFKFKEGLVNHIASQHRSARPFQCNDCGKSFATRKMVLRHELKKHNRSKLRSRVKQICMPESETNT